MNSLDNIFKFIKLTHDFQKVERVILVQGQERKENDVEHSYQLAMAAWYIITTQKLNMDIDLAIKYGLLHDLVEVYAGDTYIFDKDESVLNSKVEREQKALQQIEKEFPELTDLTALIHQYEQRGDEESKFIYALDKILPMINIYLDEGRTWREEGVTLQMLIDQKLEKVSLSPQVRQYFDDFVSILKDKEEQLFGKIST